MSATNKNNGHGSDEGEQLFDFRKVYAIVVKNWLVIKSDTIRLVPMLLFPIIMIVVFGYASTGSPHSLPAALVDYDHSVASASMATSLRSITAISIRYEVGTESEAKKLMDNGQIKAMLVIPAGFGDALDTGSRQAKLVVKVDESDSTVAQIIRGLLQQTAARFSQRYAIARLQALQATDASLAQSLQATAHYLDSLSASLSGDSSLQQDQDALGALALIFQQDVQATKAQELALRNQVGVLQNADNFNFRNVTRQPGITLPQSSSSTTDYDTQLRALQARQASDQAALQRIAILKASNARRAANSVVSALSGTAAGIEKSAGVLENNAVAVDVLLTPVAYIEEPAYGEGRKTIDFLLPAILSLVIFQGATMGMGRALAGEKKDGSLTRVFLTPTSNTTILTGTMLFYMLFESLRSSFVVFVAMVLFGVTLKGSIVLMLGLIMLYAMGCTAIGLLLSAVTNSQEQYMAVSMLVSLPAIFLSGVFFPIQTMPQVLQGISGLLPLGYAATALRGVMIKGFELSVIMPQVVILFVFTAAFTALALVVFKREIA